MKEIKLTPRTFLTYEAMTIQNIHIPYVGVLSILFGLTLLLTLFSVLMRRGMPLDTYSAKARFFLVALRLAIGWHFFVEGLEKFHSANWSSEAYLREASGPLAAPYRNLAGDRLIDKLTAVVEEKKLSPRLEAEWQTWHDAFLNHYGTHFQAIDLDKKPIQGLSEEQLDKVEKAYELAKKTTYTWLTEKTEDVTKLAAYQTQPPTTLPMTISQRIAEHERLSTLARDAEAKLPSEDSGMQKRYKDAKGDLAKWRAELKKGLDTQTANMRKSLRDVLTSQQLSNVPPLPDIVHPSLARVVWPSHAAKSLSLPEAVSPPITSWNLLDWSDQFVTYGLLGVGALLLIGFFSRFASFVGVLLVLSFYLAMIPIPGWPESPKLEGHYLLINKTLIEAIALSALTCIPTGRWAGIDGLFQLCCRK